MIVSVSSEERWYPTVRLGAAGLPSMRDALTLSTHQLCAWCGPVHDSYLLGDLDRVHAWREPCGSRGLLAVAAVAFLAAHLLLTSDTALGIALGTAALLLAAMATGAFLVGVYAVRLYLRDGAEVTITTWSVGKDLDRLLRDLDRSAAGAGVVHPRPPR